MKTVTDRPRWAAGLTRAAALCLLALTAALAHSREARAQWSAPDSQGNINSTNTGNVGIGAGTPLSKLDVNAPNDPHQPQVQIRNGSSTARLRLWADGAAQVEMWKDGTASAAAAFGMNRPGLPVGDDIVLSTFNASTLWAERFRVQNSTGNVGIGTAAPATILHASGTKPQLTLQDTSGGIIGKFGAVSNWVTIDNNRDPTTGAVLDPARPTAGISMFTRSNDSEITFWTSPTNNVAGLKRMFIDKDGNVGVGSSKPAVGTLPGLNVALGGNSYIAASNGTVNTFIGSDTSSYGIVGTLSNHPLGLRANNTLAITVMPDGNVGVGTTAPASRLHVAGNITVDGNINAKYQDVAEWVPTAQKLRAGTVVVLDTKRGNHVEASTSAYDTRVAGVVSPQPGITLGEAGEGKALVATTGRVKVKVDATRAPIQIGDLIVTSDVAGFAMRSEPVSLGGVSIHRPGTIIGKALEPLAKGTGEILVLLSLQ